MRIIGGKFKGKKLISPSNNKIRPTSDRVREAIFNILSIKIKNNFAAQNVLDLFAGSGALGLEAASRGANNIVFIDNGAHARSLIRRQIDNLALTNNVKLLGYDAANLRKNTKFPPFNLIFLDPPYQKGLGEKALISALKNGWIADKAMIIFEEQANKNIEFPEQFTISDRRKFGNSEIYFLYN